MHDVNSIIISLQVRMVCRSLTNVGWSGRTKSNSTKSNPSIDLINKTVITCQSFVVRVIELNQFTRKAKIAFGNKTRGFQNFKTT